MVDNPLVLAGEDDIAQDDLSAHALWSLGRFDWIGFARLGEDLLNAGERNNGLAQIGEDSAELPDGPDDNSFVLQERHENTNAHRSTGDAPCADEQDGGRLREDHEVADR